MTMDTAIDTHCETALESPYSRDRADAIEQMQELYPSAGEDDKEQILETLRAVAHDSSSRDERALARDTLLACFEVDSATAASVVVETFVELAEDSKFSDERLDAIDTLRQIYSDVDEPHRDVLGKTLAEIAGNATYEDERDRARRRLSDISREERQSAGKESKLNEQLSYLASSLAEHLEASATEGPEECLRRAEEVSEFLSENPVADDAFDEIEEDVESLVTQLAVVPTGDELDEERVQRVERIAGRVERLYAR